MPNLERRKIRQTSTDVEGTDISSVEVGNEGRESEGSSVEVVSDGEQLDKAETQLGVVENDIATLPADQRRPLEVEAAQIHREVDTLRRESIKPESAPGSEALVFKPKMKLPETVPSWIAGKLGIDSATPLASPPLALLEKYNDVLREDFESDPWNKRDITVAEVKAMTANNMNVISKDSFNGDLNNHTDANGMLSPRDVYAILGRSADESTPAELYAEITRTENTGDFNDDEASINMDDGDV